MTNQEAIEWLQEEYDNAKWDDRNNEEWLTVLKMSMKALELDVNKYLEEHFMVAMEKDVADDALKALEKIKIIKDIIKTHENFVELDVIRYKMICDVIKEGESE